MNNQLIDITVYGVPMSVMYEYDAGEDPVFSGPLAGPGTPSAVYLQRVMVGGVDIYDMLSSEQMDRIEETILRIVE